VAEALRLLNTTYLPAFGIFLESRLAPDCQFFLGHSFGAATALGAAYRCPALASTVVLLNPVVDWLSDDVRTALLHERFRTTTTSGVEPNNNVRDNDNGTTVLYSRGTGGYKSNVDVTGASYKKGSLH